ncbi:MAG TPA: toll/interleukin-1 receptor domain-containing protein [Longimicrobium sp.]
MAYAAGPSILLAIPLPENLGIDRWQVQDCGGCHIGASPDSRMSPVHLFISHTRAEAGIAQVIKRWIGAVFAPGARTFVSSDPMDLPAGSDWLDLTRTALERCEVFVVICSPESVHRPWINFEAGCAWYKRIPIIPICHSGLAVDDLPVPLSRFQGLDAASPSFPTAFFAALGVEPQTCAVDYAVLREELSNAIALVEPPFLDSDDNVTSLDVLKYLSDADESVPAARVAAHFGCSVGKAGYYLEELKAEFLVDVELSMTRKFYILQDGRTRLLQKKRL